MAFKKGVGMDRSAFIKMSPIYHNISFAPSPGRLSADPPLAGHFQHLSPSITLKNAPDDFCAPAWLCTTVNSTRFRTNACTKAAFSRETFISDNGERVRSLLCGREALAMPPGMAESTQGGRI